jgi:hypothetical protein
MKQEATRSTASAVGVAAFGAGARGTVARLDGAVRLTDQGVAAGGEGSGDGDGALGDPRR